MSVEDYSDLEHILYQVGVGLNFPIAEKRKVAFGNVSMRVDRVSLEMLDKRLLLALPNGTLDPEEGTLAEHDPEHYTTRRIAIEYDPQAACPEWEKMLYRTVEDKPSKVQEEYVDYLQMMFGMALFGSPPGTPRELRKATIMYGDTKTGKSSIAEVLSEFFHPNEVASESVDQMGSQYGLQRIMSARALIADDAAKKGTKIDPAVLKKLITGEAMTAQVKYQVNRSFRFRGPVVITTNHKPTIDDESNAMYDRMVVLKFDRKFTPADMEMLAPYNAVVPFLQDRGEFPGILNWSIQGGLRARELKRFGRIGDATENAKEWRGENDVVFDYLNKHGVADPAYYCSVPLLAQIISVYAVEEHQMPKGKWSPKKNSNLLVREASSLWPGIKVIRYDRADTSGNVVVGLKINEEGVLWEARAREAGNIPHGVRWKLNGKVL